MPLTIKPPRHSVLADTQLDTTSSFFDQSQVTEDYSRSRSTSPIAPLGSPLTPVVEPVFPTQTQPAPTTTSLGSDAAANGQTYQSRPEPPPAQFLAQPPSLPFSGDDATDAIALRAAISSLQLQRKKAQEDIRTLQQIKEQAATRPEEFQRHILNTSLRKEPTKRKYQLPPDSGAEDEADDDTNDGQSMESLPGRSSMDNLRNGEIPDSQPSAELQQSFASEAHHSKVPPSEFPAIPQPQDVVRCPPINWAKYNVIGEPLNRMHKEQQLRPDNGLGAHDPRRESVISATYDPFQDTIFHTTPSGRRVSAGRKDSGASSSDPDSQTRRSSKMSVG